MKNTECRECSRFKSHTPELESESLMWKIERRGGGTKKKKTEKIAVA